jgi:hypothetical protein
MIFYRYMVANMWTLFAEMVHMLNCSRFYGHDMSLRLASDMQFLYIASKILGTQTINQEKKDF